MKIFLLNFTLAIIFLVTPINIGIAQEKKLILTNEDISTKPSKPVAPNSPNNVNSAPTNPQSTKPFLSPFTATAIQTVESKKDKYQLVFKIALDGNKALVNNEVSTTIVRKDIGAIYTFQNSGHWDGDDIVLANPNLTKRVPEYLEMPIEVGGIKQELLGEVIIKGKTYQKYRVFTREMEARRSVKSSTLDCFLYVDEKTQLPYLLSVTEENYRLTMEYTNIKPGKPDITLFTPPTFIQNRVTVTQWSAGKASPTDLFRLGNKLEIKKSPDGNLFAISNPVPSNLGVYWTLIFSKTKLKEFFSMVESAKNKGQYRTSTQDSTGVYYSLSGEGYGIVILRLLPSSKDVDEGCQVFRLDRDAITWLNQTIPTLLQ